MKTETQNKKILRHLSSGKKLTAYGALNLFSCFRLASRIYDLRFDGNDIRSNRIKTPSGSSVAEYYMEKEIKLG